MGNSVASAVATVLGTGRIPIAPGTISSMVAAVCWYLVFRETPLVFLQVILIVLFVTGGIWASGRMVPEWGKDPSVIVIDEWAGMWIAIAFLPVSWQVMAAGFVLFRVFDIFKPLGIRHVEKFHGGWGIMADDVAAGVYTNVLLQLLTRTVIW